MSAPQNSVSDLQDTFVAFSKEVFEATQRLLNAQQRLTEELMEAASRTGAGDTEQEAGDQLQDDGLDNLIADEDSAEEHGGDEDADEDADGVVDEDADGGVDEDADEDVDAGGLEAEEPAEDEEDPAMATAESGRSGRGRRR